MNNKIKKKRKNKPKMKSSIFKINIEDLIYSIGLSTHVNPPNIIETTNADNVYIIVFVQFLYFKLFRSYFVFF